MCVKRFITLRITLPPVEAFHITVVLCIAAISDIHREIRKRQKIFVGDETEGLIEETRDGWWVGALELPRRRWKCGS
jgi:hypothetical protein